MEGKDLKNMLVVFALLLGAVAFGEHGILSEEEDLELDRQLRLLNKPAVKSFRTEYGDIIDCVDIFKQPAFSHPLLKNHTIQMIPSTIPTGLEGDASKEEKLLEYFVNINRCPAGSVPIARTRKEDLIAARSLQKPRSPFHSSDTTDTTIDVKGYHFAVLNYKDPTFGAKSQINVWNPSAKSDQYSSASMWLAEGDRDNENCIQVGWGVVPRLFQNGSRLNTFWTADGYMSTGCYNVLCPGFVQISTEIIPGHPLKPTSVYNGPQFEIPVSIHQDAATGNWMFMLGTKYIGYWPKAVIPGLSDGATFTSWGGSVYSPISEPSPAMGSGHYPEEGFRKAAYVNQIQVVSKTLVGATPFEDPLSYELVVDSDHPVCYSAIHEFTPAGNWGHYIYYGGPGNCIFK